MLHKTGIILYKYLICNKYTVNQHKYPLFTSCPHFNTEQKKC